MVSIITMIRTYNYDNNNNNNNNVFGVQKFLRGFQV